MNCLKRRRQSALYDQIKRFYTYERCRAIQLSIDLNLLTEFYASYVDPKTGWTPLHLLCRYQDRDFGEELVYLVDLELKTKEGWTVLDVAAQCRNFNWMRLLMDNDVELTDFLLRYMNGTGNNCLHLLARAGAPIRYFREALDSGLVDVNRVGQEFAWGRFRFYKPIDILLVFNPDPHVAILLLQKGAIPNTGVSFLEEEVMALGGQRWKKAFPLEGFWPRVIPLKNQILMVKYGATISPWLWRRDDYVVNEKVWRALYLLLLILPEKSKSPLRILPKELIRYLVTFLK